MKKSRKSKLATTPSNPTKIKLKPFVWLQYDFKKIFILTLSLIISFWLMIQVSVLFIFVFAFLVYKTFYYWMGVKKHFRAASNGGIIISNNPSLVAVYTDLGKSEWSSYPVVKIISYNNKSNKPIGTRIATSAVYLYTDSVVPHWSDFEPLPVEYATNSQVDIEAELNSYTQDFWQRLEKGIEEIPKPYKLGLYRLKEQENDWHTSNVMRVEEPVKNILVETVQWKKIIRVLLLVALGLICYAPVNDSDDMQSIVFFLLSMLFFAIAVFFIVGGVIDTFFSTLFKIVFRKSTYFILPGKVVSINPFLIAVKTDIDKFNEDKQAKNEVINVCKCDLNAVKDENIVKGQIIPMAVKFVTNKKDKITSLELRPLQSLLSEKEVIAQAKTMYDEADIDSLESSLGLIDTPYKEKMYYLNTVFDEA